MYWYCGYCWYIATGQSVSLYQYVTSTALVLLFICTGTVGTVGTLVPATQHWYQPLHIGTSHSMSMCLYVTGTTLVLLFICTGTVDTVGTLVLATLFLCTNMLLVLHWYCSLSLVLLWVLLVHWYQPLFVSVPICYWHFTGTDVYMY